MVEDDRLTSDLLRELLSAAGYAVTTATDGVTALRRVKRKNFNLILLDVWMPRMNGIEFLAQLRKNPIQPKVLILTADDTPETLLQAVREQAYRYLTKPVQPKILLEAVEDILAVREPALPIQVLSARPDWVELEVPCQLEVVERMESFLEKLRADLPEEIRNSIGHAFRELLANAIEWGGQLDPNRRVRVACLRTRRMLLYRISDPGVGFRFEGLDHAAVGHPGDEPVRHRRARQEKGLRPGGFGILMARALVDELLYNEAQNEVVLVKYLDKPPA